MKNKKIYLASPYSHTDPMIVEERVEKTMAKTAELLICGYQVFSPITYAHDIATIYDMPRDFEYWKKLNHSFIDWADVVAIYQLDGWLASAGVADEITYALDANKQRWYINQYTGNIVKHKEF